MVSESTGIASCPYQTASMLKRCFALFDQSFQILGNYNEREHDECSKQGTECGSYANTLKYLITIINVVLSTGAIFKTWTVYEIVTRFVFRKVFGN